MGLALKRRDLRTDALPSGFSLTRSGSATYYNSSGVETAASANAARFNYGRTSLTRQGLIVEKAGGNSLLRSSTLTTGAVWNLADYTVTAVAGFDNTNTAFSCVENNGVSMTGLYNTSVSAALTNPCFSIRINSSVRVWFEIAAVFASGTRRGYYNVSTDTYTAHGSVPFTAGGVIDEGGGWKRIWGYYSGAQTLNQIYFAPRAAANSSTVTGDGIKTSIFQRPQLEAGTHPTTTVNTTTATVSRGADIVSIDTPPVDTTQSFAVVLNYTLLPGASAGGPCFGEFESGLYAPTSASGRTVVRFNAATDEVYYQHSGGSLTSMGVYDHTLNTPLLGRETSATTFANAAFSGIDWYQGLATDGQMQQLSDGKILGSERGIIRKPIGRIIKPFIRSIV